MHLSSCFVLLAWLYMPEPSCAHLKCLPFSFNLIKPWETQNSGKLTHAKNSRTDTDEPSLNQPAQPPRMTTIPLPCKLESTIPIPERVHVRDLSPVLEDVPQHQREHQNQQQSSYPYHRQSPNKVQSVSEEWRLGLKENAARRYLVYVLVWVILVAIVGVVTGVCVRFA